MNPEDGRIDALAETMVQVLKRVEQMEARLGRLEQRPLAQGPFGTPAVAQPPVQMGAPPAQMTPPVQMAPPVQMGPPPLPVAAAQAVPPPLPMYAAAHPQVQPFAPVAHSVSAPAGHSAQTAAADTPQLETRMGLTWINRIGVVTLIIGVAFFFKYAIDNEWIGETGRVVLGVLAGLAALGAGDVLWRREQKVFAQGICGLGVSILYLSFYATFGFYHLLPQAAAFVLMVMATAMAGALALRYGAQAIAALGLLGGYCTPILLSTGVDAPWTFFGYLFLLNVGAISIARARRWRPLDLMAFIATFILYAAWFAQWFRPAKEVVASTAALSFYALFAFVEWPWIFYAAQVLTGLGPAAIWPGTTPYLTMSLIVGAAGLVIADQLRDAQPGAIPSRKPLASTFSFVTFWGAYALWKAFTARSEDISAIFLLLTVAFLMYLLWTPFQVIVRRVEVRTQHLTVLALNGLAYFASGYVLLEANYKAWMGLFAAAVAGAHLLLGMMLWKELTAAPSAEGQAARRDTRPVLLALGIALGFLTLAVPIQFSGFDITLVWALEAAALVWISLRTNEDRVLFGALAVYAFVFLRLYLSDGWALGSNHALLANTRFVTFAVSAVSFGLGAWWLKATRPMAAALYVTGHFIMLSACLLEFNDWVSTSVSADNRGSMLAIGVSILMASYAVVLIAVGVGLRSVLDRILGLGLIGLVVVKLYLFDVWEVSRIFRMAAFVALGALLLLTSYLYSRFRPAIESWWRDEEASK